MASIASIKTRMVATAITTTIAIVWADTVASASSSAVASTSGSFSPKMSNAVVVGVVVEPVDAMVAVFVVGPGADGVVGRTVLPDVAAVERSVATMTVLAAAVGTAAVATAVVWSSGLQTHSCGQTDSSSA